MSNGPRRPLDMAELEGESSQFCWGEGLEPLSVRGKPPSEGGRRRGTTPGCEPIFVSNGR
jgi:hypothetical protein